VVLAPFRVDAVLTAFIAFGMKAAVNIGELMKSALASVDRGQVQAARTLGFTGPGAFFNITFPQALRFGRNVYRTTVIDLLQQTSIAGYITITELTRVVNGMQSRTGKPFISMMIGIMLYLILAAVINIIFMITETKKQKRAKG
jgi:polar amino acid transport system permease protein/polar amino acid transport system substrate-binding protein